MCVHVRACLDNGGNGGSLRRRPTVSFHNFKSQNLKLSKYVAYLSVPSQISNCQGLGRKNKHDILKTDRATTSIVTTLIVSTSIITTFITIITNSNNYYSYY